MENDHRIYKKYKNRHIYDLKMSTYVDLSEILDVVRNGESVRILDSSSGVDLTYRILVQGLLKLEQDNHLQVPELIKRIIRSESGCFTGYITELESKRKSVLFPDLVRSHSEAQSVYN